jgi:hypothetical protein
VTRRGIRTEHLLNEGKASSLLPLDHLIWSLLTAQDAMGLDASLYFGHNKSRFTAFTDFVSNFRTYIIT